MNRRQVHKFGGSSLADSRCFQRVCKLILANTHSGDLVVVSAAGKTTNQLLAILEPQSYENRQQKLTTLFHYQKELIEQLLDKARAQPLVQALQTDLDTLASSCLKVLSSFEQADCLGYGEIWSARLLAALLNQQATQAQWLDARVFFRAGEGPQPEIDVESSRALLEPVLASFPQARLIVTGFVARNHQNQSLILGRNGSDYSASMLAVLAQARKVTIWTDVAGVFSADPRKVDGAHSIPLLSLQEANELARLGSPVLHARTLQPLLNTQIRASVRSTFAAEGNHTEMISGQAGDKGAKTVTNLDQVSVISLELLKGVAEGVLSDQIQRFLNRHQLMPLALHTSREHNALRLCFTKELATSAFSLLKDYQHGGHITLDDQFSMLALVGAGVRDNARHYHSFYRGLENQPLEFIETGPDGVSLVAVVRRTNMDELVAQLHQSIVSPDKRLGLVLFGVGKIGQAWLELFLKEKAHLANHHNMAVELVAIASKEQAIVDFAGLPTEECLNFKGLGKAYETQDLLKLLATHPYDELVLIDASGSTTIAEHYPQLFAAGCHIVSANKEPASAPLSTYQEIVQHQQERARHWLYGATVSACLPVTESIEAMQLAGDKIELIEGVFSGTWSRLLSEYDGKTSFTQLLKKAWEDGVTEPDPREDLTGQDVVRKLLILSRKLGTYLEPEQICCQSLLPSSWEAMSLEACWQDGAQLDRLMAEHYQAAQAKGESLCYRAEWNQSSGIKVELISVPSEHLLAHVPAAVTNVAIRSQWYSNSPILLQGPGAGPILAAGAIQMDLFRLCRLLKQI